MSAHFQPQNFLRKSPMETPGIKTLFLREESPAVILTADFETDNFSAKKAQSAALAFPSTGGDVRDILRASP